MSEIFKLLQNQPAPEHTPQLQTSETINETTKVQSNDNPQVEVLLDEKTQDSSPPKEGVFLGKLTRAFH
jgi:hypothetical protein